MNFTSTSSWVRRTLPLSIFMLLATLLLGQNKAQLVKDINIGTLSSNVSNLVRYKGKVYFTANDATTRNLFVIDSLQPQNGVQPITLALNGGVFNSKDAPLLIKNALYFPVKTGQAIDLWKFDGNTAVKVDTLARLPVEVLDSYLSVLTVSQDEIYFTIKGRDKMNPSRIELFKHNGIQGNMRNLGIYQDNKTITTPYQFADFKTNAVYPTGQVTFSDITLDSSNLNNNFRGISRRIRAFDGINYKDIYASTWKIDNANTTPPQSSTFKIIGTLDNDILFVVNGSGGIGPNSDTLFRIDKDGVRKIANPRFIRPKGSIKINQSIFTYDDYNAVVKIDDFASPERTFNQTIVGLSNINNKVIANIIGNGGTYGFQQNYALVLSGTDSQEAAAFPLEYQGTSTRSNDNGFFVATTYFSGDTVTLKLFKTEGTKSTTKEIGIISKCNKNNRTADIDPSCPCSTFSQTDLSSIVYDSVFYFTQMDNTHGLELWKMNLRGFSAISPCDSDKIAPIIACPQGQNLITTGTCAVGNWTSPTVTDNCGTPSVTSTYQSGFCFPIGTTTVTYYATDAKSNSAGCTFNIRVTQEAVNAANCPSTSQAPWNEWITEVRLGTFVNASDKIRTDRYAIGYSDFTDKVISVNKGQIYPFSISNGLSWSGSQVNLNYRVWIDYNRNNIFEDSEKAFESTGISLAAIGNITIPTTATVGSTRMRVSMKKDAYPTACETFAAGEVEDYTVQIADVSTNPCTNDVTPPVWSNCPANFSLLTNTTTQFGQWTNPTATDNCAVTAIFPNYPSGTDFGIGTTQVTYSAWDAANNKAVCSFTVTVAAQANTADCTSKSNNASNEWIANVKFANLNNATTQARPDRYVVGYSDWTDKIAIVTIGQPYLLSITPGLITANYQTTLICRVWIDYNKNGIYERAEMVLENYSLGEVMNQSVSIPTALLGTTKMRVSLKKGQVQTACETFDAGEVEDYTVQFTDGTTNPCANDSQAPVFAGVPANITVSCGNAIPTTTNPTASDNCSTISQINVIFQETRTALTIKRTWTATDVRGNSATASQTITILDNIAPVFTGCPQNISVTTNGACEVVPWNAPSSVSDNCGAPDVTWTPVAGTCFPIGTHPISYVATDNAGNQTTCRFTITVSGNNTTGTCKKYTVSSTNSICNPATWQPYLLRIGADRYVADVVEFKETSAGTATLKGTLRAPNWQIVPIDLTFSGKTTTGTAQKINCLTPSVSTANWAYYSTVSGTIGLPLGTVTINTLSNALQIGTGANTQNVNNLGGYAKLQNGTTMYDLAFNMTNETAVACETVSNTCTNNALNFDGNDDYLQTPQYLIPANSNFTIEASFTSTATTTGCQGEFKRLLALELSNSSNRLEIGDCAGQLTLFYFISGGNAKLLNIPNATTLRDGNFHHVAAVKTGDILTIYYDGVLVLTEAGLANINNVARELYVGRWAGGTSENWKGNVDEVRVWNYAVTATDITNRRNCQLSDTESGLILYFPFNQGVSGGVNTTITSALDKSPSNITTPLSFFGMQGSTSNFVCSTQTLTQGCTSTNPCATDVTPPVFANCPANISLTTTSTTAIGTWTAPTATDNCTATPSVSSNFSSGFAFPIGTTTVIYTAKDNLNNTKTCSFTVTVTTQTTSGGANDIGLTISATPSTYRQWTPITVRVSAKNNGTTAMTNVKIELKRPTKTSSGGAKTPSLGTFNDYCAGGIECSEWVIPSLAGGATATLDAPFFVLDATLPIVVTTTLLASTPTDATASNNTASVSIAPQTAVTAPAIAQLAYQKPTQLIPIVVQRIAPNPTSGELVVKLESLDEREVVFDFFNTLGKLVKTEKRAVDKGVNRVEFEVYNLEQGVHFIIPSTTQGYKVPTKFVKM